MRPSRAPGVLMKPLSAQAHAPNRPSGADKQEVQNKGESRLSRSSRSDRAVIAANRHVCPSRCLPKVTRNGKPDVTRGGVMPGVLAEIGKRMQDTNMSARMTFLAFGL